MGIASGNVHYNYAQLEGIWVQAGGNPQAAPMAAAIATAESGGNSAAFDDDSNGSIDRGLWQINSVHGSQSTFDIMGNARAAVAISNNGSNWSPWVTYTTGAYRQFLQGNPPPPDTNAPINGTNAAAGTGSSGTQTQLDSCGAWEWVLIPGACIAGGGKGAPQLPGQSASGIGGTFSSLAPEGIASGIVKGIIQGVINPFIQIIAGTLGIVGGATLMIGGMFLIVKETQTYQEVSSGVGGAKQDVGMFAWLAGPEAGAAEEAGAAGGASRRQLPQRQPRQPDTAELLRAEAARYRGYAQATDAYRRAQAS